MDLSDFTNLEKLNCMGNWLTKLTLPVNLANLKELHLTHNMLTGSLDFLSNMKNLKILGIGDNDFNKVNLDKLPRSLEEISYYACRENCKLTKIIPELDKVKFAFCQKCQKPNTSRKWCQTYTEASDIYSFGMVMYELFANAYPYLDYDFNVILIRETFFYEVKKGLRPNVDEIPIPQLLKELIKKCWDVDPAKRPSAQELYRTLDTWETEVHNKKDTLFYQQYRKIEEEYNLFSKTTTYRINSTSVVTSIPI